MTGVQAASPLARSTSATCRGEQGGGSSQARRQRQAFMQAVWEATGYTTAGSRQQDGGRRTHPARSALAHSAPQ
jgi:hypothetical protein